MRVMNLHPKPTSISACLLILFTLCIANAALALQSDKDQLFNIQADGAEIDEKSGVFTYYGNVQITQGTMVISADRIKIKMANSTVIQITASMKRGTDALAHYEQLPEENAELVLADAREINYLIQEEKLHLTGQARLSQQPNLFEGELLYYDLKLGRVNMDGSKDAMNSSGRINMTLMPGKD